MCGARNTVADMHGYAGMCFPRRILHVMIADLLLLCRDRNRRKRIRSITICRGCILRLLGLGKGSEGGMGNDGHKDVEFISQGDGMGLAALIGGSVQYNDVLKCGNPVLGVGDGT